jgi:hypothetical protein
VWEKPISRTLVRGNMRRALMGRSWVAAHQHTRSRELRVPVEFSLLFWVFFGFFGVLSFFQILFFYFWFFLFWTYFNLNNFLIWIFLKFEQFSNLIFFNLEQISNLGNKFEISSKFQTWRNFEFEQILNFEENSNLNKFWIW